MMPFAAWQAARLAALTAEDGWLNLTDRVAIGPGPQRVGRAPDNDIVLTVGPDHLGTLHPGWQLETPLGLLEFQGDGNPMLRVPPLLLEIHTVEGEAALRVRDLTLPRGVDLRTFPHDPAWVIRARWEALETPELFSIDQKGAGATKVSLTHRAHFEHAGQPVTLLATHWKAGQPMFVVRDQTSGRQTYAASRFLLGEDMTGGEITLDFNKAHNPPCAFTDHAICPLPPRSNIMPFAIAAGELALA